MMMIKVMFAFTLVGFVLFRTVRLWGPTASTLVRNILILVILASIFLPALIAGRWFIRFRKLLKTAELQGLKRQVQVLQYLWWACILYLVYLT